MDSTQHDLSDDGFEKDHPQECSFEKFPEPRTIPDKWDLSEILKSSEQSERSPDGNPRSEGQVPSSTNSQNEDIPNQDHEEVNSNPGLLPDWYYEQNSAPRTMQSGWDLSEFRDNKS